MRYMDIPKTKADAARSYSYLVKWMALAVVAGACGSLLVRGFLVAIRVISEMLADTPIPLPVVPLFGALVAGGILYRIEPHAAGEGIPSYIRGIRLHKGDLPASVTFFKLWSALATLCTFGNGGVVGPIGRVSAGVMSFVMRIALRAHIGFSMEDRRTSAICGLAAAVGAIFHSSIGAGIFAVEIIQRTKMGYKDLFPAILSSATAVFVCKTVGWESFYTFPTVDAFMDVGMIGWLVLLAVLAGVLGGLYTSLYGGIARLFGRTRGNVFLKVIVGSAAASLIGALLNEDLMGTSRRMIGAVFTGDLAGDIIAGNLFDFFSIGAVLVIVLVAKALCNCLTVGSGMSAGFTGPTVIVGMLLGAAMAYYLKVEYCSATYYAFVAAGFSGLLASTMNVPLAAAVMTTEIFGIQYSFPAGIAAVVGFQVTRHRTLYDYAVSGTGLEEETG